MTHSDSREMYTGRINPKPWDLFGPILGTHLLLTFFAVDARAEAQFLDFGGCPKAYEIGQVLMLPSRH